MLQQSRKGEIVLTIKIYYRENDVDQNQYCNDAASLGSLERSIRVDRRREFESSSNYRRNCY